MTGWFSVTLTEGISGKQKTILTGGLRARRVVIVPLKWSLGHMCGEYIGKIR